MINHPRVEILYLKMYPQTIQKSIGSDRLILDILAPVKLAFRATAPLDALATGL